VATTYPHGNPCTRVLRWRSRKPLQACLSM
jgi:hypothetical protein